MLKRKMKVPLGNEGDVPRLEWSNQNPDAVWLKNCDGNTLSLPSVMYWQRRTHLLDGREVDECCGQAVNKLKGIQGLTA